MIELQKQREEEEGLSDSGFGGPSWREWVGFYRTHHLRTYSRARNAEDNKGDKAQGENTPKQVIIGPIEVKKEDTTWLGDTPNSFHFWYFIIEA
ncbi:hypothetical protein ACFXTI_014351 [Malus domestica]